MKNTQILIGLVALIVVAGGGYYFLVMNKQPATPGETMMEQNTSAPSEASGDVDESVVEQTQTTPEDSTVGTETTKQFTVTGSPFKFDVAQIKVKKGDTVTITFKNAQGMHDWVLDEFNARTNQLQAGQEETISFVADQVGEFEYYCSVGNHRQQGMVGKLIVEE